MQLTPEQMNIINSTGNIKINAVAGSGKTSTLIEYARTRPPGSKILYLAFNRSVRLEAAQKFAAKGLHNVSVETAHSLAFKFVVPKNGYKVRAQGYKTTEIAEMLRLQSTGEKHTEYIVANHISRLIAHYCNSDKQNIYEVDYLAPLGDGKAKAFAGAHFKYIQKKAEILLQRMEEGKIDITHDFYLKKFQLMHPVLNYDYILFDEGQDASPAMLDIFLQQRAIKVIVGDSSQQIYSWRHAVNSLEKTDFNPYSLSTSFRFGHDVAKLASEVLKYKKYINRSDKIEITGTGAASTIRTKAVIGRSNLGLLLRAIDYITCEDPVKQLYFEGNINSYTYADDGTSLYDVLNLANSKYHLIKDKLIRSMKYLIELEEYVKKTEDVQLDMMIRIVRKYGNDIPAILKMLKERHVANDEKQKAEIIFSTVHRCKGMEYDEVRLVEDFITEEKLKKFMEGKTEKLTPAKANEEINLLYVAVTRAKVRLHIPENIVPIGFPSSESIHLVKAMVAEEEPAGLRPLKDKIYSLEEKRKPQKSAYATWDAEADHELRVLVREGMSTQQMAAHFGRTKRAIESRIKRLGLEKYHRIWKKNKA